MSDVEGLRGVITPASLGVMTPSGLIPDTNRGIWRVTFYDSAYVPSRAVRHFPTKEEAVTAARAWLDVNRFHTVEVTCGNDGKPVTNW